jgi:protein SCO1/2
MLLLIGAVLLFCVGTRGPAAAHEATFRGLVLATVPAKGEAVIRHDALLGHPAAIATFRVTARDLATLRGGATIEATADADSTPWTLSDIHVLGREALTGAAGSANVSAVPQLLRNVHHVVVGEYAPTPAFVDQAGKPFSLRDLRGRMVVLAFIYTRCRDARECPLVTARFKALQDRFGAMPVHLVEVTLDPAYDRPRVLAAYGRTFGEDPKRWTFATGDPETVLDFAAQFDVTAFPDERVGLIHPERTVVLDSYGAIRELIDEGAWTPDEIVAAVQHDERLSSNPVERLDLWLSSAAVSVCGNAVAGFSGFTDLLTVLAIAAFFGFLLWRVGRSIAKGTV